MFVHQSEVDKQDLVPGRRLEFEIVTDEVKKKSKAVKCVPEGTPERARMTNEDKADEDKEKPKTSGEETGAKTNSNLVMNWPLPTGRLAGSRLPFLHPALNIVY